MLPIFILESPYFFKLKALNFDNWLICVPLILQDSWSYREQSSVIQSHGKLAPSSQIISGTDPPPTNASYQKYRRASVDGE